MKRILLILSTLVLSFLLIGARLKASDGLTDDELKMLQDPGGWEYISMSDPDAGVQTQHTCFDGKPHPQECSGTLVLTAGNTFTQSVHIHGQTVERHGNYQLDGKQLSFFDEFGNKDGPYTIAINIQTKQLAMQNPPARMQLELETQYRDELLGRKKPTQ